MLSNALSCFDSVMMSHTTEIEIEERDEMLEMAEQLLDVDHTEEPFDEFNNEDNSYDMALKPEGFFSRSFFSRMPAFASSTQMFTPMLNTGRTVPDITDELDDILELAEEVPQTHPKPIPASMFSNMQVYGSSRQQSKQPQRSFPSKQQPLNQMSLAAHLEELDRILEMAEQVLDIDPLDMKMSPLNLTSHARGGDSQKKRNLIPSDENDDDDDEAFIDPFSNDHEEEEDSSASLDFDSLFGPAPKRARFNTAAEDDNTEPIPSACVSSLVMPQQEDAISAAEKFRFRSYQSEVWMERLQELCDFRARFGNCLVPHNWAGNVPLAQWVKRQRYQYKLKEEGRHSTLSDERQAILEDMGFIWDSHGAAWEERWLEMFEFQKKYGHSNVPSKFSENPQLSVWVKCQRRQYKLFVKGEKSTMTAERVSRMDTLGFLWSPRKL